MSDKSKRGSNYSAFDKDKLVNIVDQYKDIIENVKTDAATNLMKDKVWETITAEFNATSAAKRTCISLRALFKRIKEDAKKHLSTDKVSFNSYDYFKFQFI